MNLEYWSTVLTKLSPLKIDSQLCSRRITPKSTCDRCVKACPFESISFDDRELMVGKCYYCGHCVAQCPNDVFRLDDRHLYSASGSEQGLVLSCQPYVDGLGKWKEKEHLLKINCFHQLYPELILALLAKHGKITFLMDAHQCQDCLQFSLENLKQTLKAYEQTWGPVDSSAITHTKDLALVEKLMKASADTQMPSNEGRRSFLRQTFLGAKTLPQRTINNALEKWEDEKDILDKDFTIPDGHSVKKYYLKKALEMHSKPNLDAPLPYQALRAKDCNFCGVCSLLCPTKALQLKTDSEEKQLYYSPHLCSNCNVCTSICFFESLYWGAFSTAKDLRNKTTYIIAKGKPEDNLPDNTGLIKSGFSM